MTPLDIVLRIESMRDAQLGPSDMLDALSLLEDELLGDPSGKSLKALRYERTAQFWDRDTRPQAPESAAYWRKKAAEARA